MTTRTRIFLLCYMWFLFAIPASINVWTRHWWISDDQEGAFFIKENGRYINVHDSEKHQRAFLTQSGVCFLVVLQCLVIVWICTKPKHLPPPVQPTPNP